jgi:hypothetical protein
MKFLRLFVVFLFLTLVSNSLHAEKSVPSTAGGTSGHEQEKKNGSERNL